MGPRARGFCSKYPKKRTRSIELLPDFTSRITARGRNRDPEACHLNGEEGTLARSERRYMDTARSRLKATIVKPEQALPIKAFGLDMHILLTSESTGRHFGHYRGPRTRRRPARPRPF